MQSGIPLIIAAPSGAGKTSLVKALVESMRMIKVSVSHTTRPKRNGEQDGVNYHFVTIAEFEKLNKAAAFLESAKVFGNYYGTSKKWVEEQLAAGNDVIFEIDWQGARQLHRKLPQAISIFILPPSLTVLEQRLKQRGQDDSAAIAQRMEQAHSEISHYDEFDYLVVNNNFDQALQELQAIVLAERLKLPRQRNKLQRSIDELLVNKDFG